MSMIWLTAIDPTNPRSQMMFSRPILICAALAAAMTPGFAGSDSPPRSLDALINPDPKAQSPQQPAPAPALEPKRDGQLFDPNTKDVLVIDGRGHAVDPSSAGIADALRRLNKAVEALKSSREALPD